MDDRPGPASWVQALALVCLVAVVALVVMGHHKPTHVRGQRFLQCGAVTAPPEFGAGSVGPGNEIRDTTGTEATSAIFTTVNAAAQPGDEILMHGDSYAGFVARPGVLYRPYNCEAVTITGEVDFTESSDGATLAGVTVNSTASLRAVRIGGPNTTAADPVTDIIVRNSIVHGGTAQAFESTGWTRNITGTGLDIEGGRDFHAVNVLASAAAVGDDDPELILTNSLIHKDESFAYGVTEDGIQTQGAGDVLVEHISFGNLNEGTAEDYVDVKDGAGPSPSFTMRHSFADGDLVEAGCFITQAIPPTVVLVEHNKFQNCARAPVTRVWLGGDNVLKNYVAEFRDNEMWNSGLTVRHSTGTKLGPGDIWNPTGSGGFLNLGTTNPGDVPTDVVIDGETLNNITATVNAGSTYTCTNTVENPGTSLDCTPP